MGEFIIKLPDVGEGIAEAELVEWNVAVGDLVRQDDVLCAVMTDKATVEIPSVADGAVLSLGAEIGDAVAVGSVLVRLDIDGGKRSVRQSDQESPAMAATKPAVSGAVLRRTGGRPLASPAVRLRARESGVDLRAVTGTGPAGRISHDDLDRFMKQDLPCGTGQSNRIENSAITKIKVVGLRRKIAEKMSISKSRIPHITIVEEVDVTALEELRSQLNNSRNDDQQKLTVLPFIMSAMVVALKTQLALNAIYDDEKNVVQQHGGIHMGIAAQTPSGLMVPVVRHCENRDIWSCASEVKRVTDLAKSGGASVEQLSGSTITITSLGALGGIVTTPIINYPEVAIIGINKIAVRPVWDGTQFIPRKMMNLSSSFDHRIIDGWDAATFVQQLKTLLETPARIFLGMAE